MSLASRNLALVIWVGVCSSGGGLSALGRFKSTQFESVLSEWTMVLSKWFQAISVAVPHSVASVIPDVVFSQVTGHKVCWSAGSDLTSVFLGNQECMICWHCWHEPLDCLVVVHEGVAQLFSLLMGSQEIMLVEETHYEARPFSCCCLYIALFSTLKQTHCACMWFYMCFGPLVCGTEYEACCRLNLDVAGQRIRNVETNSIGTVPLRLVVVHSNMDDITPNKQKQNCDFSWVIENRKNKK